MAATFRKLKKSLSQKFSTLNCESSNSSSPPPPPCPSSQSSTESAAGTAPPSSASRSSSSSAISKLSRSFSSRVSSKKNCAICLSNLITGQGQAIFTAECSHSFHFICIANNVKHGNVRCPICRSTWNAVPFQAPSNVADPQQNGLGQIHAAVYHHQLTSQPQAELEPLRFSDDEPLPPSITPTQSSVPQTVAIEGYTESSAISADESRPAFPVLVKVCAPPLQNDHGHGCGRTPIDLITVLDLSGSMSGTKLALVKRAVKFVIENLGPSDRLSIVSFSETAQRVFPLKRMTADGRESAILAVESLTTRGGTNIVEGLKKAIRVLEQRRQRNQVDSIILLSDGRDNCNRGPETTSGISNPVLEFLNQLPSNREYGRIPVHAFGFGTDHDPTTMHAISDASGGTFSFIESVSMIQDAFAMCIGGLLSVVAQELRLTVRSASPGVRIVSIPSGKYASEVYDEGHKAFVEVGNMYAEEEKQFLVYLHVPASPLPTGNIGEQERKTSLLDASCLYKDLATSELTQARGERIVILRPQYWSPENEMVSVEVDRQRNRILVAEGIEEAQAMAEMGNLEGAQAILAQRRLTLLASAAAQAGDGLSHWLAAELRQIRDRMASGEMYTQTGRAYVLSGLSSHLWQRATTRGDMTTQILTMSSEGGNSRTSNGTIGYETPTMVTMVTMSQNLGLHSAAPQPQ